MTAAPGWRPSAHSPITSHRPSLTPNEGDIASCDTCNTLFLGARQYGTVVWILLRWWHKGALRARLTGKGIRRAPGQSHGYIPGPT